MMSCRLCGVIAELEDSHLIPNSIVKRFYRTSPTGGARTVGEPNRREQSFLHKPLLCSACEDRFALHEKRWIEEIDQRLGEPLPWSFVCSESHRYFAASVAWRNIVWWQINDPSNGFREQDYQSIYSAEVGLQKYLLGNALYPVGLPTWSHLVMPPDAYTDAPPGLNVYLRGSLDATINGMDASLYSIGVCAGYLLVTVISIDPDHLITWTLGTELNPGKTVHVDPWRFPEDPSFRKTIAARAKAVHESTQRLSPRQRHNIKQRVETINSASLVGNPHVVATLTDHLNMGRRELDDVFSGGS